MNKTITGVVASLMMLSSVAKADIYYGDWNQDIKSFKITCKVDRYENADGEWKTIDEEFVEKFKRIMEGQIEIDPRDPRLNVKRHINRSNGTDSINGITRPAKWSMVRVIDNLDTGGKNIMIMYILDYKSSKNFTANVLTIDPSTGKGITIYDWHQSKIKGKWRDELSDCWRPL
jgi:hypothetical protein